MSFKVNIHARASADLEDIYDFIAAYSDAAADRTLTLIKHAVLSLADFPRRCAIAPESQKSSIELRQLIIGNYRVIYMIIGNTVNVLRIVHATKRINPAELF